MSNAPPQTNAGHSDQAFVKASQYTFETLAQLYNQSRIDYIVPMPMNARRMEEYILYNDVALDASIVTLNGSGEETGIGMLGLRDRRAWFTRLGVIPERRGHKVGQFITENLIQQARNNDATHGQLEVIEGNEPAFNLFRKLGFEPTRKLLVIRRPPGKAKTSALSDTTGATLLTQDEIHACLTARTDQPSWLDETASLLHAGMLEGLCLGGDWVIYRKTTVQLSAFIFNAPENAPLLIRAVHQRHPMLDTKIENVETHLWAAYQAAGYFEAFARIEMHLSL